MKKRLKKALGTVSQISGFKSKLKPINVRFTSPHDGRPVPPLHPANSSLSDWIYGPEKAVIRCYSHLIVPT